jgi:hypothetical protein
MEPILLVLILRKITDQVACCRVPENALFIHFQRSTHQVYVTPEFEGKLECINYMCARIKLHTRNDSVNIKYSAKA